MESSSDGSIFEIEVRRITPMPTKLIYPNFLMILIVKRIINAFIRGKKIKATSDSNTG
jgi:hypothetical protein